jgi:hypothetical protein
LKKNHLGDGNLYHLKAEDEPEHPDYPKNPAFKAQFGPRGGLKCFVRFRKIWSA